MGDPLEAICAILFLLLNVKTVCTAMAFSLLKGKPHELAWGPNDDGPLDDGAALDKGQPR